MPSASSVLVQLLRRTASAFVAGRSHTGRRIPGRPRRGRVRQPENMRAGNATALAASSRPRSLLRAAAAPIGCAPSGDTASAAAKWLKTTGRVLPVVTDRLFTTTAARALTIQLTSSRQVGRFRSSRAPIQSEYTLHPPSDCPTNQDHLSGPAVRPAQTRRPRPRRGREVRTSGSR